MQRLLLTAAAVVLTLAASAPAAAQAPSPTRADRALDAALERLVAAPGGPPGAISIVQRGRRSEVHRAGVGDVATGAPPQANDHMRIASASKAFVGATLLALADAGTLSLADPIGRHVERLPAAWSDVTIAQLLSHTSGVPDFTATRAFREWIVKNLRTTVSPRRLLAFVDDQPLEFAPGSEYRYSNTDNIVAGLIVEAVTGRDYARELRARVLRPLGLGETSLPTGWRMPRPFIHGYAIDPPAAPEDVSELASASSSWAAGGIVSTPRDLNRFIRGYVGRRLFGRAVQDEQFAFVAGESQPAGPGTNAAGLSVFRYRTACGTLYGHTGNIFGYTQLMAATESGRRSLTVSINSQLAQGGDERAYAALRSVFRAAACAALARR